MILILISSAEHFGINILEHVIPLRLLFMYLSVYSPAWYKISSILLAKTQ